MTGHVDLLLDVAAFVVIAATLAVVCHITGLDYTTSIAGAALFHALRAHSRARAVANVTADLASTTAKFVGMFRA